MAHSSNSDGKPSVVFDQLAALEPRNRHRDDSAVDLSLLVFLDDHDFTNSEASRIRHDISWLQFIDGLAVYFVLDVAHTVVNFETDERRGSVLLVNESGTVQNQWDIPSNTGDLESIRRTVEQAIDEGEVER